MLGSAADADDVLQEAWLRWAANDNDARAEVRDPRAYLVRTVTMTSRPTLEGTPHRIRDKRQPTLSHSGGASEPVRRLFAARLRRSGWRSRRW
jgi:DNA-directed RNA polymerase specialized sigma24 family protein